MQRDGERHISVATEIVLNLLEKRTKKMWMFALN